MPSYPVCNALTGAMRLAFFRPPATGAFAPQARVLAALVLIHVAIAFLFQLAGAGLDGVFNVYELPRAFWLLALAVLCGVACAEAANDSALALRVAVAACALAVIIAIPLGLTGLLFERGALEPIRQRFGYHLWYGFLAWWAAALSVAIVRLVPAPALVRLRAVAYGLVLLVAPAYWIPAGPLWSRAYDSAWNEDDRSRISEAAFYGQQRLLDQALDSLAPSRAGIEDVYVLAAALYASEDVFMKEVGVIADLLEQRFDARGRTVRLVNNPATLSTVPIATMTSIREALAAIGKRMDANEDVLVLYLTSHGSEKHRLSVDLWPLELAEIDPGGLRKALDDAGVRWRVIVVSACYSGGYIEPLRNDHTLVITASAATRQSFGCGSESDFTYLAKALFDEELRRSLSFEEAFANARRTIAAREQAKGFVASEPQIHVGAAMREKLRSVEARLGAIAAARPDDETNADAGVPELDPLGDAAERHHP